MAQRIALAVPEAERDGVVPGKAKDWRETEKGVV
jgi:hypothetical protein